MAMYWIVILLLVALIAIDMRRAHAQYQKDNNMGKMALHGALLVGLAALTASALDTVLSAEFELPFIETHHVVRRTRHFLHAHKAIVHLPKPKKAKK